MEDKFISSKELESQLIEIEQLGYSLNRNLLLLNQKIKYLLEKIKLCKDIDSAQKYFDLLDMIQLTLATLIFKEEIGIPQRLQNFVSNFDNLAEIKNQLFSRIKSGEYEF